MQTLQLQNKILQGCEQRCYCENGEVLCQDACYEISEEPPGYLSCAKDIAIKMPKIDRPCCETWGCPPVPEKIELENVVTEAQNATAVIIKAKVPRALNGKEGFFQVFYTSGLHQDPNEWPMKEIKPPGGLFDVNSEGETQVLLNELLPNQQYFLRLALNIQESSQNRIEVLSDILSVVTPIIDPIIDIIREPIDTKLSVDGIKSSSAYVSWRFFNLQEKQYIDGVQIRFSTLIDGALSGVPGTTPFIHRDTNFFMLTDLKPDTEYQVDLYLIPVPKAETEYVSSNNVTFKTPAPAEGKCYLIGKP